MNKICIVSGIKNLLTRNYKISSDLIDVDALVDDTLSFKENWENIKSTINIPCCPNCGGYLR